MARATQFKHAPADVAAQDTSPLMPKDMRRQEFGRNLWRLILARGMTQSDLSRASGIGRDSISGYVRGRNLPEPKSAKALADALGVTVETLYPGATDRAMESEVPEFDMRVAQGHPGYAWLRINKRVSFGVAARIAALLEDDAKKDAPL